MSWHGWAPPAYVPAPGERVRCPQCRRPVAADMLYPVDELPEAVRARWARPAVAWACDACRATLHREGHITRGDVLRFLGAPEAVAAQVEAKEPNRGARGRHTAAIAASDQRRGRARG